MLLACARDTITSSSSNATRDQQQQKLKLEGEGDQQEQERDSGSLTLTLHESGDSTFILPAVPSTHRNAVATGAAVTHIAAGGGAHVTQWKRVAVPVRQTWFAMKWPTQQQRNTPADTATRSAALPATSPTAASEVPGDAVFIEFEASLLSNKGRGR